MDIMEECLQEADELITAILRKIGLDYSKHRDLIAIEVWQEGHYEGNWDVTVSFEDGMPSLRCIQEDEYDQSMDEDENRPQWERMITGNPVYTWFADDTQ